MIYLSSILTNLHPTLILVYLQMISAEDHGSFNAMSASVRADEWDITAMVLLPSRFYTLVTQAISTTAKGKESRIDTVKRQ